MAHYDGREQGYSLIELSKKPLVVVLGEARSGKTTELRLTIDDLNDENEADFSCALKI